MLDNAAPIKPKEIRNNSLVGQELSGRVVNAVVCNTDIPNDSSLQECDVDGRDELREEEQVL